MTEPPEPFSDEYFEHLRACRQPCWLVLGASTEELTALLELFGEVDAVCSEDDVFSQGQTSLGRIYRAHERARKVFDPTYVAAHGKRRRKNDPVG